MGFTVRAARALRRPAVVSTLIAAGVLGAAASPAAANGLALANGDVLAATGSATVKNFTAAGVLQDSLTDTSGATYTTGMCFDSTGHLYVTDFAQTISKYDSGGNLVTSPFGSGYGSGQPESCTVDAADHIFVGGPRSPTVTELDTSGAVLATFTVASAGGTNGPDWVDLAANQCSLYYASEGGTIKRFNVCTNTQEADVATGLPAPCFALRIRPNGETMIACSSEALRLDASGNVVQTYPISGASSLFALNLDPDGTSFWTGDTITGAVYHVDIATGNVIQTFNSAPSSGLFGLAVVGEIAVAQDTLTLLPATASDTVGTSQQLTATLTNNGAGSVAGQSIAFTVTGANSATGTAITNGGGVATFSYTGANAGVDTAVASFTRTGGVVVHSHSSTITWSTVTALPPTASIATPANGATFTFGQVVAANYGCLAGTGGTLKSCVGPVPVGGNVDTSAVGPHTFTVTATDTDGQTGKATSTYSVKAAPPTASITKPEDGATYTVGDAVASQYACAAGAGSTLTSCVGTVANGAAVDTSTAGSHTFKVTATDADGQTAVATSTYKVNPAPTQLTAPPLVLKVLPGGRIAVFEVDATLTYGVAKKPLAGKKITFTAGGITLCSGTTNTAGTATCTYGGAGLLSAVFAPLSYHAAFAGDADYLASGVNAPVVEVLAIGLL